MTAQDRLRAALADPVDRAHAEVPHVVIATGDDPHLLAGCLLAWAGFQTLREAGPSYQALAEDWEFLSRRHAVLLGRLPARQVTLANVSEDRDDVDLHTLLFTRPAVEAASRTLIPFRTRRT